MPFYNRLVVVVVVVHDDDDVPRRKDTRTRVVETKQSRQCVSLPTRKNRRLFSRDNPLVVTLYAMHGFYPLSSPLGVIERRKQDVVGCERRAPERQERRDMSSDSSQFPRRSIKSKRNH